MAGVCGGEVPVGRDMIFISAALPCGDFLYQHLLVGDAAIEPLPRENAEFRFRHIQPDSVLRGAVPFEPLDEPACLGRRKRFVE